MLLANIGRRCDVLGLVQDICTVCSFDVQQT